MLLNNIKIRKGIFSVILAGSVAAFPIGAAAAFQPEAETPAVVAGEDIIIEEPVSELQEDHVPLALQEPDVFTSDYGESTITRKMTQAEKSQNAAENDSWGGAITIIAMCIVIGALIVLSVLFMLFGKVSEALITSRKMKAKKAAEHDDHENQELAPGEVIAAISLALTERFGEGHDVEDTILTIRRMQKAYSPWNSKIYNLRVAGDHRRNPSTEINFNESKRIQI